MSLPRAAVLVLAGGVCAALHVGKLPPALPALQAALGVTLVEAGFLLSLVQLAGMALGVGVGALADRIGLARSMVLGLALLASASAAGGAANGVALLLVLRALEGFGFLLAVLPAPALLRRLVAQDAIPGVIGLWGAYMPLATALALLSGPFVIGVFGWRAWWWGLAALTAAMALGVAHAVPVLPASHAATSWAARLAGTLKAPGPWLVAVTFALYSAQWLAVIGFLPTIYAAAGLPPAANALLTALAAAVNMVGNIAAGRWLQRGVAPARLLQAGFGAMAIGALVAFAETGLPAPLRYAAVLLFSTLGGMVPATLFACAMRVAPGEAAIAATVGWVQQWSAFGQLAGPPLVGWIAATAGGWQWTGLATATCAAGGALLAARLARHATPSAQRR